MKELVEKIAEHLKPLQEEFSGYKFKYTKSMSGFIIEVVEQNTTHKSFVPIGNKLFYKKANCDKMEFYVRVLQTTEINLDMLKEIFAKVERALRQYYYNVVGNNG